MFRAQRIRHYSKPLACSAKGITLFADDEIAFVAFGCAIAGVAPGETAQEPGEALGRAQREEFRTAACVAFLLGLEPDAGILAGLLLGRRQRR